MNPRAEKRQEICDALTAEGIDALPYWPESFTPPMALVGPDPDFLQTFEGASYGGAIAGFAVTFVAAAGVNENAVDEIDDLIDRGYAALHRLDGFNVGACRPGNFDGRLAASIALSAEVRHKEYP